MLTPKVTAAWVAALAGVLVIAAGPTPVRAQSGDAAVQDQIRALKQQIDQLNKQVEELAKKQQQAAAAAPAAPGPAKPAAPAEPKYEAFAKGFFGALDFSIDGTTKGMDNMVAYGFASTGATGGPPFVNTGPKGVPNPFGRVGWLGMMSSNGSNVGYRGTHKIENTDIDLIYQVSTSLNMVAAPGLQNTWTKSSNTVQGAIGLGDTYIGFQNKLWGRFRFGELLTPYRTTTDRLNPFAGQLGDYGVVMGNTGGDNRVEFGTRMDHVIAYTSPTWQGFSFEASYTFGQNTDSNSLLTPLGSPDCAGSNNPGSGNLFLNCDDGGFQDAYGIVLKYDQGPLYVTGGYEIHKKVNRSSDGIGSNSLYYGYVYGAGLADQTPSANGCPNTPAGSTAASRLSLQILDWADYIAFCNEFPGAAAAGSPAYNTAVDVADEDAFKIGGQYRFDFGLTVSYIWEELRRKVPDIMMFQNERQRTGDWLALDYTFNGGADRVAVGWAHAGASVGDPAGQHNFDPTKLGANQANMYTIAWWHKLDKQLTWFLNMAETANDGNAHYDIGAGTHGIKTDCHDATHAMFIDYSSAGPTTWGGCHPIGVSTGVSYRF